MLKIIPLGGLGEIGLNMMAVEYGETIIVVDAGTLSHEPIAAAVAKGADVVVYSSAIAKNNPEYAAAAAAGALMGVLTPDGRALSRDRGDKPAADEAPPKHFTAAETKYEVVQELGRGHLKAQPPAPPRPTMTTSVSRSHRVTSRSLRGWAGFVLALSDMDSTSAGAAVPAATARLPAGQGRRRTLRDRRSSRPEQEAEARYRRGGRSPGARRGEPGPPRRQRRDDESVLKWLERADEAMYDAKRRGRNVTRLAS